MGELDVGGQMHTHSPNAIRALRPLVKWKLESENNAERVTGNSASSSTSKIFQPSMGMMQNASIRGAVFRRGTVVEHECVSSNVAATEHKRTIRLCVSVKRDKLMDPLLGTPLPSTTFIFRSRDSKGNAFERAYNPSDCYLLVPEDGDEVMKTSLPVYRSRKVKAGDTAIYEFFISLGELVSLFSSHCIHVLI